MCKEKLCKKCGVSKPFEELVKNKESKDGVRNCCKECRNKQFNIIDNKPEHKERKKNYSLIPDVKDKKKQYNKAYSKDYYSYPNVKKHVKNYINIPENKDRKNNIYKQRREYDSIFRLQTNIRALIYHSFFDYDFKKSSKTAIILGCSYKEFHIYLESLFEPWMNWNNHGVYTGNYNETWQIDHIKPLASANTEEDIIRLNHYTNLRPLCSRKNLEKGDKINYV
jgi:hypothetical protein